eukprot:gene7529-8366_t
MRHQIPKAPTLIVNANPGKEVLEKPKMDFESLKDNKEVTSQKEHLVVSLNDLDNNPEICKVAKSPVCHEMLTENIKFQDKIVAQTTTDCRMLSTSDVTHQEHGDDKDSTEERKHLMQEGMPFEKSLEQVEEACGGNNHLIEELKHDHSSSLQVYAGVKDSENGPESSKVVIDEEGEEEFDFNSHEKKEKLENQNADTLNSFESCDAVLECSPKLSSDSGQRDAGLENVKENHFGMPNSCFSQEKRQIVKPKRPPPPINFQKKKIDSQSEPFDTIGATDGNVNPAGFIQGPCLERRRRRLPKIPQSPLKSFETAPQQHESSTLSNKVSNFQHLIDKKDRISHGHDVDSKVKMPSNLSKVKEEERTKRNALKINRDALKVAPPVGRRIKTNADRISCPFPTATAEETLAAVHSRLNDKWKCRSLTVPDQQACDSSPPKGELFHYLEKQRKKTEAAKEELSQPEMKPNIDKMTGEEQEVEDAVLFDHVLVVKLKQGSSGLEPFISYRFPPKQTSEKEVDPRIASIPQFCFPDLRHGMSEQDYRELHAGYKRSETFSFVLTDMVGQRHFGYCRQIQISDSKTTTAHASPLPEVYCIVSPHGLFGLYSQILNEVEKQCEYSSTSVFSFLKAGHSLDIKFFSGGRHGFKSVTLYRAGDSAIHEHVDFKQLFDCLSVQMATLHSTKNPVSNRRNVFLQRIDALNKAVTKLLTVREPTNWKTVLVEITISEIKTIDCSTQEVLMEDRVRFISFLGVAKDERMCGYIVAVGMETFVCHVFCCIPHAGTLTRAMEEACKLRYEKFLHKSSAENSSQTQEVETSLPQFQPRSSVKEKGSALKSSVQGLFQKLQKRDSKKKDDSYQTNQDQKMPTLQPGANEYLVKYFGCVQVELGTGIETVQESVEQLSGGAMMIGFLEVTKDGLTLCDSQRTALSRRVIDLDTVSYCGVTSNNGYFGIIQSQGRGKYACHVCQEYKTPVTSIVSAIHEML